MDKIASAKKAVAEAKKVFAQQQPQATQNPMDQLQQSVNKSMGVEGPSTFEQVKAWLKSLIDAASSEQDLSKSVTEGLKNLQKK